MNARTTNILTYSALGVAAAGACMLPKNLGPASASAFAPAPLSETMILPSIIRDFRGAHGDFNVTLAGGNGHYAGNVALSLNASDLPSYLASGYRVSTQWRDVGTNPIAPHMYLNESVGREVRLVNAPSIVNNPTVDSFDSTIGPYGGSNVGPAPIFVSGSAMAPIVQPAGMPALVGTVEFAGNGTTTISSDIHCENFIVRNQHTVRISGHVRIVATELFQIRNHTALEILPNSSLTVWTHNDVVFENNIDVNVNSGSPSLLVINHTGTGDVLIENIGQVYASIHAPNAAMRIRNNASFFGRYSGKDIEVQNHCSVHIDTNGYGRVCGVMANDSLGTKGANSAAGVSSAATFAQWYADTLGVNLSTGHDLILTKDGTGAWQYSDNAFFPIDGRLFGNENMAHNHYFTLSASAMFTHHACDGRYFEFSGADDFWLFIDGRLVLDIGGVVPMQKQRIDIDRLALNDGQAYRIDIFYAQRNPSVSAFHLRTNLDLHPQSSSYTVSAGHD